MAKLKPTGTKMAPGAAMAAAVFVQALAITLQKTDVLAPADRKSRTLLRLFHGYFGELLEGVDADTRQNALELLAGLHHALEHLNVSYDPPSMNDPRVN